MKRAWCWLETETGKHPRSAICISTLKQRLAQLEHKLGAAQTEERHGTKSMIERDMVWERIRVQKRDRDPVRWPVARRMLMLLEAEETMDGKITMANVNSTAAVRVAAEGGLN